MDSSSLDHEDVKGTESKDKAFSEGLYEAAGVGDVEPQQDTKKETTERQNVYAQDTALPQRTQIAQENPDLEKGENIERTDTALTSASTKPYSSFGSMEKKMIVLAATIAAFFSPFTAQIYFPALNQLATDLHVTSSKINLTMTTYMVCHTSPILASFSSEYL